MFFFFINFCLTCAEKKLMDHFNSIGNNCLPDQGEKQKELLKIGGEYLVIFLINKLILEEMKLLCFSKVSNFSNIVSLHKTCIYGSCS